MGCIQAKRQSFGTQAKVALGVVQGIGHEPHMRQVWALSKGFKNRRRKIKAWHEHVPGHHPKRICQCWQCPHHTTGRLQCPTKIQVFAGVTQLHGHRWMGLEIVGNVVAQPSGVDERLCKTGFRQMLKMPRDQGFAMDFKQGLGSVVTQGAHALPASSAEHQGLGLERRRG